MPASIFFILFSNRKVPFSFKFGTDFEKSQFLKLLHFFTEKADTGQDFGVQLFRQLRTGAVSFCLI